MRRPWATEIAHVERGQPAFVVSQHGMPRRMRPSGATPAGPGPILPADLYRHSASSSHIVTHGV